MKITKLTIAPDRDYYDVGPDNPLKAVVKLKSEDSVIECVLSDETMLKMIDLVADQVVKDAGRKMDEFRQAVLTYEGDKSAVMIEGN